MKVRRHQTALIVMLGSGLALAAIAPALAATVWTGSHTHYGGVAFSGTAGDCYYTYDALLPGGASTDIGWGSSVGDSGCDQVRARLYVASPPGPSAWSSWRASASGLVDSAHLPRAMWSGHQVED